MRILLLLPLVLSGCASVEPYFDAKAVYQNDPGSDWMLRSDRPWVDNGPLTVEFQVGVEFENNYECFIETAPYKSLWHTHLGCAKAWHFGGDTKPFFMQVELRHQLEHYSSWWTDSSPRDVRGLTNDPHMLHYNNAYHDKGVRWSGDNPYAHLRAGFEWRRDKTVKIRCPVIATGRSITQGWPTESENAPRSTDLYWSHLECGVRLGGK